MSVSAKRQAFIEMDTIEAATNLVNTFAINPPQLRGKHVMFQYSTRQEISLNENHARFSDVPQNRILLVSIADMRALVQIEHLEQVFQAHGVVNKIVIFEKNGFHAFVEMKTAEEATRALQRLHGQSLFVGCCTLSVQYSTLEKLSMPQVPDNRKARDYQMIRDPMAVNPAAQQQHPSALFGAPQHPTDPAQAQAQAQAARFFQQHSMMHMPQHQQGKQQQQIGGIPAAQLGGMGQMQQPFGAQNRGFPTPMGFPHPQMGGAQFRPMSGALDSRINLEPGGVILVNNLDETKVNPDALFNLFGVFGDVYRVKILFKKKSSALVQMANGNQATLAMNFLNRHTLWGQELYITHSKFQEVQLPRQGSGIDPDSEEANLTKDYSNSRAHRFRRTDSKNFKNVCAPSKILHLANLHEGATEQELYDLFQEFGITKVQFFNVNRAMALVEAPNTDVASQILIKYHNHQLGDRNMKISFSRKTQIPDFSDRNANESKEGGDAVSSS